MALNRRNFLRLSAGQAGLGGALLYGLPAWTRPAANPLDALRPMTGDVEPISLAERQGRVQKAQRLMADNKIQAIVLDSGTSMVYFTGIGWGASERPMIAVIPAHGDVKYVCPAFEAERL